MEVHLTTKREHEDLLSAVVALRGQCSPTKARNLIKSGLIALDGKINRIPRTPVKPGQKVSFESSPKKKENIKTPFPILHEDASVCVFEKPAGIPAMKSGKTIKSAADSVIDYLRPKYGDEIYSVINRVDKKESGLMLIALGLKNSRAIKEDKGLSYRHYALVEGAPKRDKLRWTHHLVKNSIGLYKPQSPGNGKEANTDVRLMNTKGPYSLLKLSPLDYFKGQLRAQCALQGMPIAGDKRYGAKSNPLQRTCMHLFSIRFTHPESHKPMEVKSRVPSEFLKLVKGK